MELIFLQREQRSPDNIYIKKKSLAKNMILYLWHYPQHYNVLNGRKENTRFTWKTLEQGKKPR